MRDDTIDLNLFGTPIRLICEDAPSRDRLRTDLSEHLIDQPAPVGFALQAPNGARNRLYVLVDRSGLVLARSRSADECLEVLIEHLGVFAPPPPGTVRFRVRALLDENTEAVLALPPTLTFPPLVERRLERANHRMIDRVAVDIGVDGAIKFSPSPWSGTGRSGPPMGHTRAPSQAPVTTILVPGALATRASVSWSLAAATLGVSDRQRAMTLAGVLAGARSLPVDPERSLSVYSQLVGNSLTKDD